MRISLDNKSKYQSTEENFLLKVNNIYNSDKNIKIEFIGKEKMLCYYEKDFPYNIGDIVKVKGSLYQANNNTTPNLFNYHKYLEDKDIYYLIKINEITLYQKNHNLINEFKKMITKRINNLPKKEYLYAFILGDKSWIDDDLNQSFIDNNLLYLLSIGSIQVYFITKILDYLKIFFRIKEKYHLLALSLVFSFFFLLLKDSIGILRSMSCYILKRLLKYYHIKYRY